MIVINLKNYKKGDEILNLVKTIEIYYNKAIVAVPPIELERSVKSTNIQIISQHVDFHESGKSTGFILPENLASIGVGMSLLNHSEHKLKVSQIRKTIKRCNEMGIKLIVCASSLYETKKLMKLNPYAIAFEDKKLISTGKSITSMKGSEVRKFAELFKDSEIIPLCGAGISSGEDVAHALVLGCKGVLVASAVAHSQTPEKFLKEVQDVL